MQAISAGDAVRMLADAVEGMRPDDLAEIYGELFPGKLVSDKTQPDRGKIVKHIRSGIEVEEILDNWNVAFPEARNVHFDDETGMICYEEQAAALRYAD